MYRRASRRFSSPQGPQGGARAVPPQAQPQPARPPLGNQALQHMLRSGAVRGPLTIDQPEDHREQGSAGRTLEGSLRGFFEPRFRNDFSDVRVHTGPRAEGMARSLQARAFTFGRDVFFGAGFYDPDSRSGRRLLAHELAHVVQQRRMPHQLIQRQALSDFNDTDPNHDPGRLTDAQIQATEEYRLLTTFAFPPLPQQAVTPEEALLTCRLMLRHLREGGTVDRSKDGDRFIGRAKRQLGTLTAASALETHLNWVPFDTAAAVSDPSKLPTEFGRWVLAGGTQPSGLSGKVNCWEMILLGAFQGGFITFARIQQIYQRAVDNVRNGTASLVGDTVESELRARARENVFDATSPSTPEPLPGDIVIFKTAATHTVISLGTKTAAGEHEVLSLWNRPNNNFQTQKTTIEALRAAGSPGPVKFWSPTWTP